MLVQEPGLAFHPSGGRCVTTHLAGLCLAHARQRHEPEFQAQMILGPRGGFNVAEAGIAVVTQDGLRGLTEQAILPVHGFERRGRPVPRLDAAEEPCMLGSKPVGASPA